MAVGFLQRLQKLQSVEKLHFGLRSWGLMTVIVFCLPLFAPLEASNRAGDLKSKLQKSGRHLELSASYKPELRIESLLPEREARFGDCSFYDDFLRLIDIERSTAVEAKIRKLDLDEASRFIYLYGQRLKSQNKWSESFTEKMDNFRSSLGLLNCPVADEERSPTQDD